MKANADNLSIAQLLVPATYKTNQNGSSVDLANVNANAIVVSVGAVTDGTYAFALQDSPDNSTWTAVAAGNMVGAFVGAAANTVQKVGYLGAQRYLRVVSTVGGSPSTGMALEIFAVLENKRKHPQS